MQTIKQVLTKKLRYFYPDSEDEEMHERLFHFFAHRLCFSPEFAHHKWKTRVHQSTYQAKDHVKEKAKQRQSVRCHSHFPSSVKKEVLKLIPVLLTHLQNLRKRRREFISTDNSGSKRRRFVALWTSSHFFKSTNYMNRTDSEDYSEGEDPAEFDDSEEETEQDRQEGTNGA